MTSKSSKALEVSVSDEIVTPMSRAKTFLELARIPNVFTAISNVAMGYVVANQFAVPPPGDPAAQWSSGLFALLVGASGLLYLAGMVLNDVFDAELDAVERPERPIPSGRVSLAVARVLGWELVILGVGCAWLASFFGNVWRPGVVGTALACAVVLYDAVLKPTPFGPVMMAVCRGLNVLLGMSLTTDAATGLPLDWSAPHWWIAGGVAVYTLGLTQISRNEAFGGVRAYLIVGTIVLLGGMAMLAATPFFVDSLSISPLRWRILWAVLFAIIGWRCVRAIIDPRPPMVRAAVKHAVMSFVFLDAALAAGLVGPNYGVMILCLLIPAIALGKWFEST